MLEPIRLLTVHPALVHFTIGALPIIVLAYAVAAWRKAERWTFAGDVSLGAATLLTFATFAFGLVSNAVAPWPAGIATWRWIHLASGAFTTALFVVFAAVRFARRRRHPISGRWTVAAACGLSIIVAFTGWVGGEVLVFHSGVGVKAAADGGLAPPLTSRPGTPKDVHAAMGQIRASWAAVTASLATMIVEHPEADGFASIATEAAKLQRLAEWLRRRAGEPVSGLVTPGAVPITLPSGTDPFVAMASALGAAAAELEQAGHRKDLAGATRAFGSVSARCVGCHEQTRWK